MLTLTKHGMVLDYRTCDLADGGSRVGITVLIEIRSLSKDDDGT